jgi:polysaccharide pyruvyl transferase WcaK-like protein
LIRVIINTIGTFFKKRIKVIAYDGKIYDFLQDFCRLNFVICCKYHSILLSYLFEKPMIVLCFHPKNFALVNDIKLPKKSLCSASDILNGRFYSFLLELLNDFNSFKAEYSMYEAKKRAIAGILHCINVV